MQLAPGRVLTFLFVDRRLSVELSLVLGQVSSCPASVLPSILFSSPSLSLIFSPFPFVFLSLPLFPLTSMTRLTSDIGHFDFGLVDYFLNPATMDGVVSDATSPSIISSCPSPGLTSLPDDVLLLVISLIGVEDILALRMVWSPRS